ncbi:MAG: DUF86 domain-containing protein [Geminicoccaceae bacterium]
MRRRREAAEGDLSADGGSGLVTGAASVAGGVGGVGAACTGAGATATALRFAAGKSRGDLEQDQMLLFALVHAVKIVGEAAAKITPATRAALPCVPWPLIVGVRNRLVHA